MFQRYYRCLELKSKDQNASVPPLDETLRKITEPDPELLSQNRAVTDEFRRSFELKEHPKVTFTIILFTSSLTSLRDINLVCAAVEEIIYKFVN